MMPDITNTDEHLWQQLVAHETTYVQARMAFLQHCPNRIAFIQSGLHHPSDRSTALRLLDYLPLEDRQALFKDLLDLASVSHSDIDLCRQAILALPKQWLLNTIEDAAETILHSATDEEYRRLLELYCLIDRALAQRLTTQALNHPDPDIREVGEDFEYSLKKGHLPLAG